MKSVISKVPEYGLPAFFLLFLLPLFWEAVEHNNFGGLPWLAWSLLVVFATVFILCFVRLPLFPQKVEFRPWLWLTGMIVIAAGFAVLTAPVYFMWLLPFVASTGCYVLPRRFAIILGIGILIVASTIGWFLRTDSNTLPVLISLAFVFALNLIFSAMLLANERRAAAESRLAVISERERLSQDMHDALGHTLTAVAIRAELAQRLIDTDPEKARIEIGEVRQQVGTALEQVREVVSGLRSHDLGTQISGLQETLRIAGVSLNITGDVQDIDPALRPVMSWILREAGTNVLRHSDARNCEIVFAPDSMEVIDDGVGRTNGGVDGHGIHGMHERAESQGLQVEILERSTGGTRVRVQRKPAA